MSPGSSRPDGKGLILLWLLWLVAGTAAGADDLPAAIREVKPSVVGVGTYMVLRRQQDKLLGTGFVVGTGKTMC
jgi:serine protease Do